MYEQWKYPPQIHMHGETSDPSAVHSITYIEKDKMKVLRWNLGYLPLEYSKWKDFRVKYIIQSKSISYYNGFGKTIDYVARVHFQFIIWAESISDYFGLWGLFDSIQNT